MNGTINPKLKPLLKDLEDLGIGNYLKTTEFRRATIELNFERLWDKLFLRTQQERNWISSHSDHDRFDSEVAFRYLIEILFQEKKTMFYTYINAIITRFIKWDNHEKDYSGIMKDLTLIGIDEVNYIEIENMINEKRRKLLEIQKLNKNKESTRKLTNQTQEKKSSKALLSIDILECKKNWIKLIAKAELEKVIEEIYEFSEKIESYNILKEVVNLSARLSRLKKKNNSGMISQEDSDVQISKISNSFIDLINSMDKLI